MKWTKIAVFGGAFACLTFGLVAIAADFAKFVSATNTYNRISFSDTRDDVMYRLGYPRFVFAQIGVDPAYDEHNTSQVDWYQLYDTSGNDAVNRMPEGTTVQDFSVWTYDAEGASTVDTSFASDGRLLTVSCMARKRNYSDSSCPSAYGIRVGDNEVDVFARLGDSGTTSFSGVSKSIDFDTLGVTFTLEREVVYRIVRRRPTASMADYLLVYLSGIGWSRSTRTD